MIGPYEFPPKFVWTNGAQHEVLFLGTDLDLEKMSSVIVLVHGNLAVVSRALRAVRLHAPSRCCDPLWRRQLAIRIRDSESIFVDSALPPWLVIFFPLTEAPLPDPTPTPPNTPKRTRETEPKRSRNGAEMDRNQAFHGGTGRGFVGMGWGGGL